MSDLSRGGAANAFARPPAKEPTGYTSHLQGPLSFRADLHRPLTGLPLKTGEVWLLRSHELAGGKSFQRVTLSVYTQGLSIEMDASTDEEFEEEEEEPEKAKVSRSFCWTPFVLIQALRLHEHRADQLAEASTRLLKVALFQQETIFHFAIQGEEPDQERARWIAVLSQALRDATLLFFPPSVLRTEPLPGAAWTQTRLFAGHALLCRHNLISLVYLELHSHEEGVAQFIAYDDELCNSTVLRLFLTQHTMVCERVGVDCSCFAVETHDLCARTAAEKRIWLRTISNLKVKMRNQASAPSLEELQHYRQSIRDHAVQVGAVDRDGRCRPARCEGLSPSAVPLLHHGSPLRRQQPPPQQGEEEEEEEESEDNVHWDQEPVSREGAAVSPSSSGPRPGRSCTL